MVSRVPLGSKASTLAAASLATQPLVPKASCSALQFELDDGALTGNEGAEADLMKPIVVDEEALQHAHQRPTGAGASSSSRNTYADEYLETAKLLFAGGVAGAVSKSCTAPLARLTILFQVQGLQAATCGGIGFSTRLGTLAALQHIIRREGVRALWKGNGVTIIHRLPYSSVNFYTYEQVNELWKKHMPESSPLGPAEPVVRRLVAGGVAGLTACTVAYPLDLVRTLLAAQTGPQYHRGIGQIISTIVQTEGVRGLYRGLGATLMQVGPSLAVNYAAYETIRSHWLSKTDRTTPTVGMSLACGSLAGLVSSTATFPLDLVRRRMQLQGQGGTRVVYRSFGSALRSIAAKEGVRGLYAGILPEYYKVIPGVAVAFMTYELLKKSLNVHTNATGR